MRRKVMIFLAVVAVATAMIAMATLTLVVVLAACAPRAMSGKEVIFPLRAVATAIRG
ncbi:hypothetical protein [Streptosporangium sp. KLBMP 9127]|nr:hypothetical protein [Streptosporangium sp. KLBMP 9127]